MTFVAERVNYQSQSNIHRQSEGIWHEEAIGHTRRVTFSKPVPIQIIEHYAKIAVRHAQIQPNEEGGWIGTMPDMPGVWAEEASLAEVIDVLEEVIFDWVLVKIESEDRDLPIIDDIDLNVV